MRKLRKRDLRRARVVCCGLLGFAGLLSPERARLVQQVAEFLRR